MAKLSDFESFLIKNGFIWGPEPEIYGGLAGFYTYGPLGTLLKRNVENLLRSGFKEENFFEIEAPIIAPREVWKGSGHLDSFVDKVIVCKKCKSSFRVDKLAEKENLSIEKFMELVKKEKIKCPNCHGNFDPKIESYNLMVKAEVGGREAYCRPETATMTYLTFKRYYDFFRKKLPIKVFQIGKAYRNEISPRQNVLRGREFTQAEAQIFILEEQEFSDHFINKLKEFKSKKILFWPAEFQENNKKEKLMNYHELTKFTKKPAYLYTLFLTHSLFERMGIPKDKIRLRQHKKDERAHYALDAWDVEVKTSLGWIECCGVHDRSDYDLKRHSEYSHEDLIVQNEKGKNVYPNILEIAFGIDRSVYCLLDIFYTLEKVGNENRINLKLPKNITPIKLAVFPLVNKDNLDKIAFDIYVKLKKRGIDVFYDNVASIGRRYRRIDEKGVPLAVTVDYQTKEDNTITLRDKDSMKQIRTKISEIEKKTKEFISGKKEFSELEEK